MILQLLWNIATSTASGNPGSLRQAPAASGVRVVNTGVEGAVYILYLASSIASQKLSSYIPIVVATTILLFEYTF